MLPSYFVPQQQRIVYVLYMLGIQSCTIDFHKLYDGEEVEDICQQYRCIDATYFTEVCLICARDVTEDLKKHEYCLNLMEK